MDTVTQVMWNREEHETLSRAALAAFVMYADDADTMRLLNGITTVHEPVSLTRLIKAREALTALLGFLEMEARPVYWDRKVGRGEVTDRDRVMRDTIIEARKMMVVDVKAALRLIADGRRVATHPREVDDR